MTMTAVLSRSVALLAMLSVVVASQARFIARDEGFYLYAAKLITQGQVPYIDFFLPQGPLMPYLYALWFSVVGASWIKARVFGALIAIGCGWFTYLLARRAYGSSVALFAVVLGAATAVFQLWIPLGKNVGLALLLYVAALYYFSAKRAFVLAGLLLGLCIVTRFTFAPLALVFLVPLTWNRASYTRQLGLGALGMVPSGLLVLSFLYLNAPNFIDNVYSYHLERTRLSEEQLVANKEHIFLALIGIKDCIGGGEWQFPMLLLGALASCFFSARDRQVHFLLLLSAVLFSAVSFVPSPTYVQYFSVAAVLLVPATAQFFYSVSYFIGQRFRYATVRPLVTGLCIVLSLGVYVRLGYADFYRFFVSGERVIGVGDLNRHGWRMSFVSWVSQRIDELNSSGQPVFSNWPGYFLESKARALPGTENHFGHGWATYKRFSRERAQELKVASRAHVLEDLEDQRFDAAVVFVGRYRSSSLVRALTTRGMQEHEERLGVRFLTRGESEDEAR